MPAAPHASLVVSLGIPALALAVASAFVALVARGARLGGQGARPAVLAAGVLVAMATGSLLAASSGALLRFDLRPPPGLGLMVVVLGGAVALARSRVGDALVALPLPALVGFQSFRLPLELVMHQAAVDGVMPPQMSFGECNFDIVSGIVAAVVGSGLATGRLDVRAARIFQVVGSALLAAILVIALASTPMFRAFGDTPGRVNTWVFEAPYVLLPSVLVFLALTGHVALGRKLARVDATEGPSVPGAGEGPQRTADPR